MVRVFMAMLFGFASGTSGEDSPDANFLGNCGDFLIDQATQVAIDVRGEVIKGSGHWLMEEAPTLVFPAITGFVN